MKEGDKVYGLLVHRSLAGKTHAVLEQYLSTDPKELDERFESVYGKGNAHVKGFVVEVGTILRPCE